MKLGLDTIGRLPAAIHKPHYDVAALRCGIVHLGLGAFHRAHQAVFTDDAIAVHGGDWGIIGVSMRNPAVSGALASQDGLYTVETLDRESGYRVIGSIRRSLCLRQSPDAVLDAIADPHTHVITLTVTENGYCLANVLLDLTHPDIARDINHPDAPWSAIGVLVAGLARRQSAGAGPLTVISCDNLAENGPRLEAAVYTLAERRGRDLAQWINRHVAFPESVVDCIVPAATEQSRARTDRALGLHDSASVQREPFAQWVIEDRFAGPYPSWAVVGTEIVRDCADYRRLKLHVLNAAHSALAYLGLARGHTFVREAARDPEIAKFIEEMIRCEVAPALPGLDVETYWTKVRQRFANPMLDHRLDQIAQDGATKLAERYSPLMLRNLRSGRAYAQMAAVYKAWLGFMKASDAQIRDLDSLTDPVWHQSELRNAILERVP